MSSDKTSKLTDNVKWVKPFGENIIDGKYYGEQVIVINNTKFKFIKLNPGVGTGKHNHHDTKIMERDYIISGQGEVVYYHENGSILKKFKVTACEFSPTRDSNTPDHELINSGSKSLIFLGIEKNA